MSRRLAWVFAIAFLIISIMLFSRIIGYYNSGADGSNLLQTQLLDELDYYPEITWQDNYLFNQYQSVALDLEGRLVEAFFWLNRSFELSKPMKLQDYFDKDQYQKITSLLDYQVGEFEKTHTSFDLVLKHVSLDKSVAVVECINSKTLERITLFPEHPHLFYNTETFTLIMVVIDGKWKVKNWIAEQKTPVTWSKRSGSLSKKLASLEQSRGINYYPAKHPWSLFWDSINVKTLRKDFKLIDSLGFNTIRIFLSEEHFEKGSDLQNLNAFRLLLDIAQETGLQVVPTLFDFPKGFDLKHYTNQLYQLRNIVNIGKSHPALLAWSVKNEPDLDFELHGQEIILQWLKVMIKSIRDLDDRHPITIGWSDRQYLPLLADHIDYFSFHLYKDFSHWEADIESIRSKYNKLIVLEEFGFSTRDGFSNILSKSEKGQYNEINSIITNCQNNNVPFFLWTLHDFEDIPTGIFPNRPWILAKQKHFGLVRTDGSLKKSAELLLVENKKDD